MSALFSFANALLKTLHSAKISSASMQGGGKVQVVPPNSTVASIPKNSAKARNFSLPFQVLQL